MRKFLIQITWEHSHAIMKFPANSLKDALQNAKEYAGGHGSAKVESYKPKKIVINKKIVVV